MVEYWNFYLGLLLCKFNEIDENILLLMFSTHRHNNRVEINFERILLQKDNERYVYVSDFKWNWAVGEHVKKYSSC